MTKMFFFLNFIKIVNTKQSRFLIKDFDVCIVPRSAAVADAAAARGQVAGTAENPKKSKRIGKNYKLDIEYLTK
jgi:hypothetical protein